MKTIRISVHCLLLLCAGAATAGAIELPKAFPGSWRTFGRAEVTAGADTVTIANGLVANLAPSGDCIMSFRARAVPGKEPVQIWAAIRVKDRLNRYVVGLRGGLDPQVSLARYAPDGDSKFLRCATLRETPQPGTWYRLRVAVVGRRFHVYLNDESLPRINVEDQQARWCDGGVALGGGGLPTEFSDLKVTPLTGAQLAEFQAVGERTFRYPLPDREQTRVTAREAYRPVVVTNLPAVRGEISLDGTWLFMPDQDLSGGVHPDTASVSDQNWHTIVVPSLWTPTLPWLHGEGTKPGRDGNDSDRSPSDKLLTREYDRVNAQTFDWEKTKSGWYRHYIELPPDLAGRRLELVFDAIAKKADCYVNGVKVGSNTGMFRQVRWDLTGTVKPGMNLVAIHVIGTPNAIMKDAGKVQAVAVTVEVTNEMLKGVPHGIMNYNASGIWQPVRLLVTQPVRVEDVFIRPRLDGASIEVAVANGEASARLVNVSYTLRDLRDGAVLHASEGATTLSLPASGTASQVIETPKLQPKLWSPQSPNLYALELVVRSGDRTIDQHVTRFGFRTFGTEGDKLLLNGKPWFMRGANHFPNTLAPNDPVLARKFMKLAREGNVWATRSVCEPFTRTWLDAADEIGMGVSQEGIWPWLMLPPTLEDQKHKDGLPDSGLLALWKSEFSDLIRQWRNHPSILIWTVNNEMKFHAHPTKDPDLLLQKWIVLDDMIRSMRKLDPTRPIVADSDYLRKKAESVSGKLLRENRFDDGDIDDAHRYFGWYNPSFFHLFNGEFARDCGTSGRPLISQEWGGGYPRDDGWAVRSYQFARYVPQALVGDYAMEGNDPSIFLTRHSMLTKELTEVVRRTNRDQVAGLMPFSYLVWFSEVWDAARIQPQIQYDEVKKALQPVLISAELFGRHFYAGDTVRQRVCIVNDADDGEALPPGRLAWEIRAGNAILAQGRQETPSTPYYANRWLDVEFKLPASLPHPRTDARMVFSLTSGGRTVGCNDYQILLASREWSAPALGNGRKLQIFDPARRAGATLAGLEAATVNSPATLDAALPLVIGDMAAWMKFVDGASKLRDFVEAGGRVLALNPGKDLVRLLPETVKSYRSVGADSGEIVTMQIPESPVFDGLEPLDLSWFELGPHYIPRACSGTYEVDRTRLDVAALAHECMIHPAVPPGRFFTIAGAPIVQIQLGKGVILASEMRLDTRDRDPVASRLLRNMLALIAQTFRVESDGLIPGISIDDQVHDRELPRVLSDECASAKTPICPARRRYGPSTAEAAAGAVRCRGGIGSPHSQ